MCVDLSQSLSSLMVWFRCEFRRYADIRDVQMFLLVEMKSDGLKFSFTGVTV